MIDKISCSFINSVYHFNDYTLNELICKLAQKMDEVITQSNESFSYLDWLKGQGLSDEVINILLSWKENGTLNTIINENIFNEINSQLDTIIIRGETADDINNALELAQQKRLYNVFLPNREHPYLIDKEIMIKRRFKK